ncbi:TetR/AcrR family transcriptional regulator [Nocardia seriolae]|uniref:A-factor receptor protein n=1 Tax=Nocardia seriolae TaxID=37332 RepID=A0A0B8N766_9NOCA|nr:TetR/AcrR family transcriptional regulator [Nocardia seriolae]APA95696.1 A-factor receptor protein [Nocardia seriolae]MTJ66182.1 TetR family transcriptional regulator [Nocardia seriolae]MTJ75607.1 TetR family transcriptional regulator [Nocardia seriolae]MTJ85903.1 TetR family transcriptional regulator [Nocardia seriolae]MTK29898.1 TetR family transcriptional regulator [Nocardia seriolae]
MAPTDRFRPRRQPKQERSTDTRRWILDAAAQVFGEFGYGAGTTNRIAERAGISIGSLYRYFPNKDAILRALMEEHVDAGAALYQERLAVGLPLELEDCLRLIIKATIDNHRDNPRLHRVLFEEAPRAPALLARLHESEQFAVTLVTALLEQHPQVTVPDAALSARMVVVTVESMVHRLITAPNPVPAQQLEDETVILLTRYLRR